MEYAIFPASVHVTQPFGVWRSGRPSLLLADVSDDLKKMPVWSEDSAQFTATEVARLQDENRAWYKELRQSVSVLMDTKLAKKISQEEYAGRYKLLKDDLAECSRRSRLLTSEAQRRSKPEKQWRVSRVPGDHSSSA